MSRVRPDETPWLWGVNGAGSVVASSLAIMIAQRWGLTVVMMVSAGAIFVVALLLFVCFVPLPISRIRGLALVQ